jgi:pimeloyl-ACP methyl ester carboxylesterase
MNTVVNDIIDLSKEIPPDSAPLAEWFRDALSVPREEGWIESEGCPIHYFRWGNPANPPVILIHGFLAHSRCFAFIAPQLAENYHVVAYDFSGMGDSGARDAYPAKLRVAELLDVATATGLFNHTQKPTIIAHSYGGSVGLAVMEAHSSRFAGLAICDLMTLRPERMKQYLSAHKRPEPQDLLRPNRVYPDYETAKGKYVLSPPQEVAQSFLFDYMAFHSLKKVEGGWSWKFDPSVFSGTNDGKKNMLKLGFRISNAPGRKVIIYGQDSLLFDADSADYVRECGGQNIPFIGLPRSGHHLMLDEPIAFASVLDTVLAMWR